MAFMHGVSVSEVPTSILTTVEVEAGIPMIIGTAPINMTNIENVNKPVLCYSYSELVEEFGFVPAVLDEKSGLKKYEYSISEFAYSQFSLFGVAPVIVVNVLDPTKHKKDAETTSITLDSKSASVTIEETGIIASSIEIDGYTQGEDYQVTYDDDGFCVITSLTGDDEEPKMTVGEELTFAAEKLDPSAVTTDDIIGGVSTDGTKKGLELVDECFPRFRLVPGILIAPGYSSSPSVAAVMATKCAGINEMFKAISIIDVPTDTVTKYSEVAEWKNNNNITDPLQIVCYPCLQLDGTLYHFSTQLAGLLGQVDGNNEDVPYVSPSNNNLQMTGMVLEDGTEQMYGVSEANYLNSEGIVTATNFMNGWVCWGNQTACYPGNTDVKDYFICVRRMFNWLTNTLIQTYWQRVDMPLTRRQVQTITDSINVWLNGLAASQKILGGRVEFSDSENPTTDLMNGIAKFHVFFTPPVPNQEIDFLIEYDPSYFETLFG